jgi:hypothetical protein
VTIFLKRRYVLFGSHRFLIRDRDAKFAGRYKSGEDSARARAV